MAERERMRTPIEATGRVVAGNLARLRGRIPATELAERMSQLGRKTPALALRRIEALERRVDVDDLTALAAALDVSPAAMLMPPDTASDAKVHVTGDPDGHSARRVWEWLTVRWPLDDEQNPDGRRLFEFQQRSTPMWQADRHEVQTALSRVRGFVDSALEGTDPSRAYVGVPAGHDRRPALARRLRQEAESLGLALQQLADDLEHQAAADQASGDS